MVIKLQSFNFSIAALALLTMSSQSYADFDFGFHPDAPHAPVADIQFDSSIPDDQYKIMAQDLEDLEKFEFSNPDSKILSVMELRDSSSRSMLSWLKDRVHYIVSEKYKPAFQIRSESKNQTFPFANETPGSDGTNMVDFSIFDWFSPKIVTVMSNIGGGLYSFSKEEHSILTVAIPGVNDVTLTSPRTGIIQVGKGLFDKDIAGLSDEPNQSIVRFAFRMGTFFHEARHSDGHGKSLTFPHVVCPTGHDYEGTAACDKNLNGPYTVGAHFFNSLARSCKNCSAHELEMLHIEALDSFSRILPITIAKAPSDPDGKISNRLRTLARVSYLCETLQDAGVSLSNTTDKTCAKAPAYQAEIAKIKLAHPELSIQNSTYWDPSPEHVGRN